MKMVLYVAVGQLIETKRISSAMAGQSACPKSDLHRLLITFFVERCRHWPKAALFISLIEHHFHGKYSLCHDKTYT